MYTQLLFHVLLLAGCTLAYPRTYQEQRQIYYPQPIPVHQRLAAAPQVFVQPQPIVQVPAATSLLPNNINDGIRYGQHQVLYVVPSGAQVYYEEQGTGEGAGGYVDTVYNFLQGASNYFPFGSGGKPTEGAVEEGKPEKEEKPDKLEQPEKLEQATGTSGEQSNLVVGTEQLQSGGVQRPQQPQKQQIQQKYQPLFQPNFDKYLNLRNQQFYSNTPANIGLPSANFLYYQNTPQLQLSDYNKKPGASAIAFQRYLAKAKEGEVQTTTEKEGNENEEQTTTPGGEQHPETEELGPSIAQAKPQAVSVAGPGGVAAAAPVGTAIVGPGGMALSAPQATAVAGTKPKPPGNDKVRSYLPRNSAFTAYYPY